MEMKLMPLSSMTKVFPDEAPKAAPFTSATMLLGEVFSYQVAYRWYDETMSRTRARCTVESRIPATVREVGLEPVEKPSFVEALVAAPEGEYLRREPGLYPDPLLPLAEDRFDLRPRQWRSLWVTVDGRGEVEPGEYPITLRLYNERDEALGESVFTLTVLPIELPKQTLLYTEWFHCDCIAKYYGCEMMSERHWQLIEKYAATARANGITMLLTPVITPSLDTAVGTERPTMQLVRVDVTEGGYRFDFSLLGRWIEMCRRVGIEYFEIAHLFSQWGALHPPKVMAWCGDEYTRIFGWEQDSLCDEYAAFLAALLPELVAYLGAQGVFENCYFHISDEPHWSQADRYRACRALVTPYIPGERIMDALSQFEFYESGLVQLPIPANNHIGPFLEHGVQPLWTYYCCGQWLGVSNKFLAQPGSATRVIGAQMFKYRISGFLQWGFNFWFSSLSLHEIDPWRTAEGEYDWPAGDPFCVYPGKDGPVESMRIVLMNEGLQDMRALQALEAKRGHEYVVALIDEGIEPLEFDRFPRCECYLLALRERVNKALAE